MIVIATNTLGQEVTLNLFYLVCCADDVPAGNLQVFMTKGNVVNLPLDQEAVNHIREYARLRYRLGLEELARAQEEL